ncbi:MAG: RsmB/NOP family class I SAM-dependent RNA methyltransferase [candidate division WOR-3 bacterium]
MNGVRKFFPDEFCRRYEQFIPDFDLFLEAMLTPLPKVFRVNTLKAEPEEVMPLLTELDPEPLPYLQFAYTVRNGRGLGRQLAHFLGLIYIQEAASMIPPVVLDPRPGDKVLDLAAAPGSKTTQMAALMKNRGLIIANDLSLERLRGLIGNIDRMGCLNVVVCRADGIVLGRKLTASCDRVLVDAPCSSEGTIRKTEEALRRWSVHGIANFSRVQKGLICAGYQALRPGGQMVYSTCTIAPEENEAVVAYLLKRFPEAEILPVELDNFVMRPALTEWEGDTFPSAIRRCRRILPQDNNTEAFFVALIRKPDDVAS